MGWIYDHFSKPTEDWIFTLLKENQVPEEPKSNDAIAHNESYVVITLRSMRLVKVRKLFTKFYGVVHSYIRLNHLSGDCSFQTVTTPAQLRQIDPENVDRIIQVNIPLLGPIPYRGGDFALELGLFSVKDADLVAPFIEVLQKMASQAGVSVVSTAIPFVQPLRKGIDALLVGADTQLEVGVSTNLVPLKTGWYVVMRAPKQEVDVSKLRVTSEDFRLVNADTGQMFKEYPYMVFTVAQDVMRQDWYNLPDLKNPYKELQEAVRKGDYNAAKELIVTFRRSVLTSDDLITRDGVRIAQFVKQAAEEVMTATAVARGKDARELPALESYRLY